MHGDRTTLELKFTCASCGRPIVLVADQDGVSLPDRDGFLEVHAKCLVRRRVLQWPRPE